MSFNKNREEPSQSAWMPNEAHVNEIVNEVESCYQDGLKYPLVIKGETISVDPISAEKPSPEFIKDCAKIGAFLMDTNAVMRQLKKLNSLIEVESNKPENIKPKDKKPRTKFVLRNVLVQELARFGFYPEFGKAVDLISPFAFRTTLANGVMLKDPIIFLDHGEFTHAIQWLMIAWQNEESKFLDNTVINLFKQLGQEECVYSRKEEVKKNDKTGDQFREEKSIWDLIVDAPKLIQRRAYGFRNFENYRLRVRVLCG